VDGNAPPAQGIIKRKKAERVESLSAHGWALKGKANKLCENGRFANMRRTCNPKIRMNGKKYDPIPIHWPESGIEL